MSVCPQMWRLGSWGADDRQGGGGFLGDPIRLYANQGVACMGPSGLSRHLVFSFAMLVKSRTLLYKGSLSPSTGRWGIQQTETKTEQRPFLACLRGFPGLSGWPRHQTERATRCTFLGFLPPTQLLFLARHVGDRSAMSLSQGASKGGGACCLHPRLGSWA